MTDRTPSHYLQSLLVSVGVVAELVDWLQGPSNGRGRLVTGAGGSGKTRWLIEVARRMRSEGWAAGFLSDVRAEHVQDHLLVDSIDRLLVVDYPETRHEALAGLLQDLCVRNPRRDRASS